VAQDDDAEEFFAWTGRLDEMLEAMVERVKAEGPVLVVPLWTRNQSGPTGTD
jgi:hypothetical protein